MENIKNGTKHGFFVPNVCYSVEYFENFLSVDFLYLI